MPFVGTHFLQNGQDWSKDNNVNIKVEFKVKTYCKGSLGID